MASGSSVLYIVTDDVSSPLLRGQLRYLSTRGIKVTAACGTSHGGSPQGFDDTVDVKQLPLVREPSLYKDIQALIATTILIWRLQPSIVNASTPKASLIGMLASTLCRVPVRVMVIRGFRFETATGFRRWYLRALERCAASLATHVLVNSASLKEFGVRERVLDQTKAEVLGNGSGNGVDISRFVDPGDQRELRHRLGLAVDRPTIGFIGRLTKDKGIDDLLQMFDHISNQIHDIQLLLIGPFEDGDPVADLTRDRIDSHPGIVHVPFLENPTAGFRALDVFVFPSYREGLPNVVLESQVCETPVVAYAATGTVDALQKNVGGVLVPIGNVNALTQEVINLLRNPTRCRELGKAGAAWVGSRFDQNYFWGQLIDRYCRWLSESGGRQRLD